MFACISPIYHTLPKNGDPNYRTLIFPLDRNSFCKLLGIGRQRLARVKRTAHGRDGRSIGRYVDEQTNITSGVMTMEWVTFVRWLDYMLTHQGPMGVVVQCDECVACALCSANYVLTRDMSLGAHMA